jgi:hypothetical protein
MGYQIYEVWNRWGGYWVPAICEHPDCNKKIDRWMSYACWWEPFSEYWCDRYFCEEHTKFVDFDNVNWWVVKEEDYNEEREDEYEYKQVCFRCAEWKEPFPYKPETKEWVNHLLNDKSWKVWREKNPKKVKELTL